MSRCWPHKITTPLPDPHWGSKELEVSLAGPLCRQVQPMALGDPGSRSHTQARTACCAHGMGLLFPTPLLFLLPLPPFLPACAGTLPCLAFSPACTDPTGHLLTFLLPPEQKLQESGNFSASILGQGQSSEPLGKMRTEPLRCQGFIWKEKAQDTRGAWEAGGRAPRPKFRWFHAQP